MSKNQPSPATTSGNAAALINSAVQLAMAKDPEPRAAGLLILAAGIFMYLVETGRI